MLILGIDLSGPGNSADTVCTLFEQRDKALQLIDCREAATDAAIIDLVAGLPREKTCFVGLDAPLSYNPGGGDRPADKALRKALMAVGLPAGSVMPPTLTRMVYLTLRGVTVARLISETGGGCMRLAEVHPAAALALGGAPVEAVRFFKADATARRMLLGWLAEQGLRGVDAAAEPSDHYVASCACALAAWKWARNDSAWRWPAEPPHHPYDFVC